MSRVFVLVCVVLAIHATVVAAAQPASQQPVPRVVFNERIPVRGASGRMAILPNPATGGYLIVGFAGYQDGPEKTNNSWKEFTWTLTTDASGKLRELKPTPAKGNQAKVSAAVRMQNGRTFAFGGMLEWICEIAPTGELLPQNRVGPKGLDIEVSTAVADRPDSLLVAGSVSRPAVQREDENRRDAWLARIRPEGTLVWQKQFDHDKDEWACAMLPMRDGGCVLAINSGKYDKFGQGPSSVWVVRCDADGNKTAETLIAGDARLNAFGGNLRVRGGDGADDESFVLAYSTSQLKDINNGQPFAFQSRLARFDGKLAKTWEKRVPPMTTLGTPLLQRLPGERIAVLGEYDFKPTVTIMNDAGDTLAAVRVDVAGYSTMSDVLLDPHGGIVVVAGERDRDPKPGAILAGTDTAVRVFKVK